MSTAQNESHPIRAGILAARANLIPGLIVQALMFLVAGCYYFLPAAHETFTRIAAFKAANGYLFSIAIGITGGALVPEIFRILVFQNGKILRQNLLNLRFTICFWAMDGIMVDTFYRIQGATFGNDVSGATVLRKVCVDQFLMTPFFFLPITLVAYEWMHRNYDFRAMTGVFTLGFAKERGIPALITGWAIWIPLLFAIYALPALLQIPMFALALTIWVMLFTYISGRGRAAAA